MAKRRGSEIARHYASWGAGGSFATDENAPVPPLVPATPPAWKEIERERLTKLGFGMFGPVDPTVMKTAGQRALEERQAQLDEEAAAVAETAAGMREMEKLRRQRASEIGITGAEIVAKRHAAGLPSYELDDIENGPWMKIMPDGTRTALLARNDAHPDQWEEVLFDVAVAAYKKERPPRR